jgi:hypothetical protein
MGVIIDVIGKDQRLYLLSRGIKLIK